MSEPRPDDVPTLASQGQPTAANLQTPKLSDSIDPEHPTLALDSKSQDTAAVSSVPMADIDGVLRIGRFRVLSRLGTGGFGMVYRARDDELERDVAIKTPRHHQLASPEAAKAYLAEARSLASLDHPGIVPVYEVGIARDGSRYLISKYVDGRDLAQRLREGPLAPHEASEIVVRVAVALAHAHERGLIHRDIKPGNILLDKDGSPLLTDFGMALREQDLTNSTDIAGTPAYMSPEQARGEGHRIDARSDLFSLGAVFYETLTGQRPFTGEDVSELLDQVITSEPESPRHVNGAIPRELERICMKALAKRAKDRYQSALELAEDVYAWLKQSGQASTVRPLVTQNRPLIPAPESDGRSVHVVPHCLRAFDASDASSYLALLPGPYDREGLPLSVRFWKTRIESFDPEQAFAVGLLYGPSGCGKSSLVRAALLPRVGSSVHTIYLESTPHATETKLERCLRQQFPSLTEGASLHELLARLRRGEGLQSGCKVVIVLDQFEQWLFAHRMEDNTELVQALRQCDGIHVQALILIRDDFWMAASRFFRELEIPIVEGRNTAAVDLFDPRHARKVLTLFGRAYGALSQHAPSPDQASFIEQAVAGLAQDGKVISVRLALFAEMIKNRLWTPATLKTVGGAEGVGLAFLEETFTARSAPVAHRAHAPAAQSVLRVLLPDQGAEIKGHMRSLLELRSACGYDGPRFEELLRLLDQELRLITPAETEPGQPPAYQLTHDYLVPSLRAWLTKKQSETVRGRAELLLEERAALWQGKQEKRLLPSLGEWLKLILHTRQRHWTENQRHMMRHATKHHLARVAVAAIILVTLGWSIYEFERQQQAAGLVQALAAADIGDVPRLVRELEPYQSWARPALEQMTQTGEPDSKERLHAALALVRSDASPVDYLLERILKADPIQLPVIRQALLPFRSRASKSLEAILLDENRAADERFRAVCGLVILEPDNIALEKTNKQTAEYLVKENPLLVGRWVEILRPDAQRLVMPLTAIFKEEKRPESQRSVATNVLADYAAGQPEILINLALESTPSQYALLLPRIRSIAGESIKLLQRELEQEPRRDVTDPVAARNALAERQALAAVTLLHLKEADRVWPLLKQTPQPQGRTALIHALGRYGITPEPLLARLRTQPEVSERRALLLSLGELSPEGKAPAWGNALIEPLEQAYRQNSDAGLHGAVEWLLRRWGLNRRLKEIDRELASSKPKPASRNEPSWWVNGQAQTMVTIPGGVDFLMGSPDFEPDRVSNETLHRRWIVRPYALANKEVTVAEFERFKQAYPNTKHYFTRRYAPDSNCPQVSVTWYEAAMYCRWLSEVELIAEDQMCYPPVKEILACSEGQKVLQLPANYLQRTGYRLPTEAEWEYACRAGAVTSRPYGDALPYLGAYAWFLMNTSERSWPVGTKKPNEFGCFDMLGNVAEWCQDRFQTPAHAAEDNPEGDAIIEREDRVLRSGTFNLPGTILRSAGRVAFRPSSRFFSIGFRPARTLPQ